MTAQEAPEIGGLDWAALYYVSRVVLRLSKREFWEATLRELNLLAEQHVEMRGGADGDNAE